jgi:MFS transporter, FHS family, glucose/mannose:H+ symporter
VTPAPTSAGADSRQPSPASGHALAGFLLSGFLLALLGAILPAWGCHRDPADFAAVGNYFLSLALGIVTAAVLARHLMARLSSVFRLVSSCVLTCAALAYLGMVSPPASAWWRMAGLFVLGIGAGALNTALFQVISGNYRFDAAGTVIRGGIWYGLGCLAATLLVAGSFYAYSVPVILAVMAAVPAAFAIMFARSSCDLRPPPSQPALRQALKDFRSPGAILFALILFFQFGNEWSIAGWLPLFLIRRVGLSPKAALMLLALYWLFLLLGRLGAVALLPHIRHGRLLLASVASAVFGCLILYFTQSGFGAASAVFFLGAGFVSIYPLVAEAIGRRFPYYHPGFFSGIFSLAVLGGLLAPATLGYVAQISSAGVGVVVGLPLVGTWMVMLLLPMIWLEAKVTGR